MLKWIRQMFNREPTPVCSQPREDAAEQLQRDQSAIRVYSRKHEQSVNDLKATMDEVLRRIKS